MSLNEDGRGSPGRSFLVFDMPVEHSEPLHLRYIRD